MIVAEGAGASAGPLGLLIVLLMGAATVLLIRNMNSRLKKLPPSFAPPDEDDTTPADPETEAADPESKDRP